MESARCEIGGRESICQVNNTNSGTQHTPLEMRMGWPFWQLLPTLCANCVALCIGGQLVHQRDVVMTLEDNYLMEWYGAMRSTEWTPRMN